MLSKSAKLLLFSFLAATSVRAEDAPRQDAAPSSAVMDMVLATVDGEPVTASDLRTFVRAQGGVPPADVSSGDPEIRRQLRELVIDSLLRKEAEQAGISVSEEEIQAYLQEIKKQNNVDDAGFEEILKTKGIDQETYRRQVKGDLLRARILGMKIRAKINIPDEDIVRTFTQKNGSVEAVDSSMVRIERVAFSYARPDDGSVIERENKEIEAKKAREALLEGRAPASFEENYQDLGMVSEEDLKEDVQAALKTIDDAGISEVIESEKSFYIYKKSALKEGTPYIDPETRQQIRQQLFQAKFKEEVDKFLNDELPKKYHVELKL